ncbi:hypothetical protein NDU88_001352 [Pleurodeles waltl]|uniref:Uncharacterized protein n=1 Tax=Pleurodeles waltl TaxID=8319 RepID=A0AAV7SYZ8_PLEWA|nr:hypothetical protein NDU88_001352 [Pleurodeles waltl]
MTANEWTLTGKPGSSQSAERWTLVPGGSCLGFARLRKCEPRTAETCCCGGLGVPLAGEDCFFAGVCSG